MYLLLCSTGTVQSDLEQSQTTSNNQVPETGRNRMELLLLLQPETVLQKIQLLKMSRAPWFSILRKKKKNQKQKQKQEPERLCDPTLQQISIYLPCPSLHAQTAHYQGQPHSPDAELTSQAAGPWQRLGEYRDGHVPIPENIYCQDGLDVRSFLSVYPQGKVGKDGKRNYNFRRNQSC